VKQSDSTSRKITVTATYLTPKREDDPSPSGEEGTTPPPPFAEVQCSPQTIEVERVYLDFLIAETEQVTDDVLVVRDEKAQPGPSDKKVIHWAKVVVKHSAGVSLPIKLESSGSKQLYFYGEQQEGKRLDPNQLQEEPDLSGETFKTLAKSFSNEDWFWIGTEEKGSGQGKFKATANAGTGYKNAPEEKTVELVPVKINSLDRFVAGSIDLDTVENFFGGIDNFGVLFVGKNTDQTYGESSLAEAYIHEEDYLNSEGEAAQSLASLEEKSWKQDVIYYKKDGKLHFMTTVDQIDDFEIKLFKEGEEQATIDYQLTGIPEVSDFIDELDRAFGQMPFANNGVIPRQYIAEATGPDYDDYFAEERTGTDPPALMAARGMAALSNPFDPVEWRNLTSRCMVALFEELEKKTPIVAGKVAQGGEILVKQTVGYATGYLRGFWGGLKSDWEGIVELKNLLIHPIDTSCSIYEGFKAMLGLSFEKWKEISKHMLDSMMDNAKEALPWDYQGDNIADQVGLIAHINGYATGFVSEQALMVYLGAGAVSKIGQTVKVIVNASKAGRLAVELAAKGLNASRNLARRTKTSAQKYWSQFADSESDLARIAANMEGSHRRPGTAGYDNSFLNAQRALGEALADLENLTSEKLLKELGNKDLFKDLNTPDFYGRSHVMQFQRRAAQLATTLKKAGALSEDALIGFARVYKMLIKDAAVDGGGVAIQERVRDLTDLFDTSLASFGANLDAQQAKGAKALAKSLEDYKVRSEATGFDGKFWFKDVETVYDFAYKYFPTPPPGGWSSYDGVLSNPTWCTFNKIDSPELANDMLLLPSTSKNPRYRVEFGIAQAKNRTRLARGNGENDTNFEPLTDDIPASFQDAGTGQFGKTGQVIIEGSVEVDRVTDLVTGKVVWQRGN
jgi:hypothetical protein